MQEHVKTLIETNPVMKRKWEDLQVRGTKRNAAINSSSDSDAENDGEEAEHHEEEIKKVEMIDTTSKSAVY